MELRNDKTNQRKIIKHVILKEDADNINKIIHYLYKNSKYFSGDNDLININIPAIILYEQEINENVQEITLPQNQKTQEDNQAELNAKENINNQEIDVEMENLSDKESRDKQIENTEINKQFINEKIEKPDLEPSLINNEQDEIKSIHEINTENNEDDLQSIISDTIEWSSISQNTIQDLNENHSAEQLGVTKDEENKQVDQVLTLLGLNHENSPKKKIDVGDENVGQLCCFSTPTKISSEIQNKFEKTPVVMLERIELNDSPTKEDEPQVIEIETLTPIQNESSLLREPNFVQKTLRRSPRTPKRISSFNLAKLAQKSGSLNNTTEVTTVPLTPPETLKRPVTRQITSFMQRMSTRLHQNQSTPVQKDNLKKKSETRPKSRKRLLNEEPNKKEEDDDEIIILKETSPKKEQRPNKFLNEEILNKKKENDKFEDLISDYDVESYDDSDKDETYGSKRAKRPSKKSAQTRQTRYILRSTFKKTTK